MTSCHRIRKCSATSLHRRPLDSRSDVVPADAATRRVVARVEAVAGFRGQVDAADEGDRDRRSRSSSRGGSASAVPSNPGRTGSGCWSSARSRIARTSPRDGRKSGSGAPAQTRTRTSICSASSREQVAEDDLLGTPASSAKAGSKCQPVRWTCERACCIADAISGSACAPSTSTSTAFPGLAGGSPAAQPPAGGSSARSQPILCQAAPMMVADLLRELGSEPAPSQMRSARRIDRR